jgi:hypothetical protein
MGWIKHKLQFFDSYSPRSIQGVIGDLTCFGSHKCHPVATKRHRLSKENISNGPGMGSDCPAVE